MKLMSPKAFYYTVGKKNFIQYILFGIFVLFFYLPLMNLCMLAFADKYENSSRFPSNRYSNALSNPSILPKKLLIKSLSKK